MPGDEGDRGEVISLQQRREDLAAKAKQDQTPIEESVTFSLDNAALVVTDAIKDAVDAESRAQAISVALIWCKWIIDQKKQGVRFFMSKPDDNQLEEVDFPV